MKATFIGHMCRQIIIRQADRLLGPYEMVKNLYNPGGHKAGDFDLIADPVTGKGYLYFDADHASLLCMELSDDYLLAEKEAARSYANLRPPFTREAPALFEKDGIEYMLTSGMTGYVPNRSDSAVIDAWDGAFIPIGDPHVNDPLSRLRAERIGVIPQGRSAIDTLTVLENTLLPAKLYGRALPVSDAKQWMEQLGIAHLQDARPAELSGGELRRMAIVRALSQHPDFLFADEPTGDLDDENTHLVLSALRDYAHERNKAVFIVTHESDAMEYADRCFRMDGGQLTDASQGEKSSCF